MVWHAAVAAGLLVAAAGATEYWAAPNGDDGGPGSAARPFRTLARAAAAAQPGDLVTVQAGIYRETLRPPRDGAAGQPITFRAAPGAAPTVHAADALGPWQREAAGLWSAALTWDLGAGTQLFAGDQPLLEARWPNNAGTLLQPTRAKATAGNATTLTDPALPGAAADWTGATLWCAGGAQWICWSAPVTAYDPATHTLTFDSKWKEQWYTAKAGSPYVLIGTRAALDAPGEWWFDRAAQRVWLSPPGGADPNTLAITAKRRTACFDLSDRRHLVLQGMHFRGGGLLTNGASADLRLEGLRGEWVAHSWQQDLTGQAVVLAGQRIVARDCEFAHSSGGVVRLAGQDNKLLNCHIHDGDYLGMWNGTLALSGRRQVVHRCTVAHSGRDLLSVGGLQESLIQYNDLSYAGWLTHDLGITYGHNGDFSGTTIRWNRVHDNVAGGLGEGIYFDHCSHNVVIVNNLIYNIPDMPVQINNPGHFNLIAHNSAYQTNLRRNAITTFDHSHRNDLFGCRWLNNAFNAPLKLPPSATAAGNLAAADPGSQAPDQLDLRLRAESPARGTGTPVRGLTGAAPPDPGILYAGQPFPTVGHDFAAPPRDEPVWERPDLQYLSHLRHGCFEFGSLEGWTASGTTTPTVVGGNGWGNRVAGNADAPTGTSRFEARLSGDATLSQPVTIRPGTRYQLSAWLRVAAAGDKVELSLAVPGLEPFVAGGGNTVWERVVLEFTAPATATTATLTCRLADATGEARMDNVGLLELGP
ncbi:MAG: right-handed parallel beta-helix repeat-containing protein [Fimbriimonadaceae bacterium]|nr:right-handed parallel beta-helix repeat-containing protein [Fimbriimonadaceae bacterium]